MVAGMRTAATVRIFKDPPHTGRRVRPTDDLIIEDTLYHSRRGESASLYRVPS